MSAQRSARRRLVAIAAALTVLATLFPAVGSAAAVEACPTDLPSAGYKDLGGLSAETVDAIDCITYYGVATGVSSTTFDPSGVVTRWQMALFLTRLVQDLGMELPSVTTAQFDDIGGLPAATQQAINQLAQLGITTGVAPRRFDPSGVVPRWQMAMFLTRVHTRLGYMLPSGVSQGFADIGGFPATVQVAINQLAQLGIAKGVTPTTFAPAGHVYRWQMALFLARQLRAGGAVPYRISVTLEPKTAPTSIPVTATVTVLGPNRQPVVGRSVDIFVGSLDSAGRCVLDSDVKIGSGDAGTGTNCTIDKNDPKTDSSGRVSVVLTHNSVLETDRVFAWIGASGQVFDVDVVAHYAFADLVWTAEPAGIVVPSKTVKYGTNTTVTGWLVNSKGEIVVAPNFRVVVTVSRDGVKIIDTTLITDSNGLFAFSYTGPSDPSVGPDSPEVDTVVAFWDKDADGKDDGVAEFDVTATVTWDDDDPVNNSVVVGQNGVTTLKGQTVTVTATVKDKFGTPIKNAAVVFTVSGANGATSPELATNSSGVASYSYTGSSTGEDMIDVDVDVDGDDAFELNASLSHFVVEVAPNLGDTTFNGILAVDTVSNWVDVTNGSLYYRLSWDSTEDMFSTDGKTGMATFESTLDALALPTFSDTLRVDTYSASTSGASTFILDT